MCFRCIWGEAGDLSILLLHHLLSKSFTILNIIEDVLIFIFILRYLVFVLI